MRTALQTEFDQMRGAYQDQPHVSYDLRWDRLDRLEKALLAAENELIAAMSEDFSYRSPLESRLFDVNVVLAEIRSTKKYLKRWMRVQRVTTPLLYKPARAEIHPQPLGVVGIIAPWNFPVQLALGPMVPALAAGNRVMLKPSELTPQTAEVLAEMIEGAFDGDEVCVVTGGADVAAAFSALPFDHLFFTGSTQIGRRVAEAAASNLTPVTLELGGKSPAVIMPSADLDRAARRIVWGKLSNAGQICVAPDYVLVPRKILPAFADALMARMTKMFPAGIDSPDYSAIVSDRHLSRLDALLAEAETHGAEIRRLTAKTSAKTGKEAATNARKFAPALVIDPPHQITLMQEEIFGPILPLVPYDTPEQALRYVAERDHPLALYVFAEERKEQDLWLQHSLSGGAVVNDTVIHVAFDTLPFGGVGASGIGAYHGQAGFDRFSHLKSVVRQSKWNGMFVAEPPMKGLKAHAPKILRKLM
nr:coniferyl aldehyde dehydrogenase [uncultured Celeribacter sp.]